MKNALKAFCLAAAITVAIGACSGEGSGSLADSSNVDSSTIVSNRTDTLITVDSDKRDTTQLTIDTPVLKIDSMKRTITKKTIVKKTIAKKP